MVVVANPTIMKKLFKVFLVDDDIFSLNIYRQELENIGIKDISLFLNGRICLNNLHLKPKVIFMDHDMDEMTGFEVLKKIKRVDPSIYIIIVSAQENMKIAVDSLKHGAFDYLIKGDNEAEKMKQVLERIEATEKGTSKNKQPFFKKLFSLFL